MAESSTIMGLVAAFIGVAIMLVIGIQILGNVQTSTNCSALPGNATSGWQHTCETGNTQIQNAYTLLIIILIVVAAVAILFVVRML